MDVDAVNQNRCDVQSQPADKNRSKRFNKLVKNVTVMPQRLDSQLPLEPVFEPASRKGAGYNFDLMYPARLLVCRPGLRDR